MSVSSARAETTNGVTAPLSESVTKHDGTPLKDEPAINLPITPWVGTESKEEPTQAPKEMVSQGEDFPRLDPFCPGLDTPAIQVSGMLWLVMRFCHNQGHVELTQKELDEIRNLDPAVTEKLDVVSVFALVLQTLASNPDAEADMRQWAQKETRARERQPQHELILGPRLQPWKRRDLGSFGLWSATTEIVTRFLDHGLNRTEMEFAVGHGDLRETAKQDAWVVDLIIFTLYRLRASQWFWPTLFRNDLTQFPG